MAYHAWKAIGIAYEPDLVLDASARPGANRDTCSRCGAHRLTGGSGDRRVVRYRIAGHSPIQTHRPACSTEVR